MCHSLFNLFNSVWLLLYYACSQCLKILSKYVRRFLVSVDRLGTYCYTVNYVFVHRI